MRNIVLVAVVLMAAGCQTVSERYSDKAKQVLGPATDALTACEKRFYDRYRNTRADAATIGLAYDSFCIREQNGLRKAVDEYFSGTGVGIDYSNAKGDEWVSQQRNLIVGAIVRNNL